jgi:hypothetical protein
LRGGRSGTHEEEREEAIRPHSEGGAPYCGRPRAYGPKSPRH